MRLLGLGRKRPKDWINKSLWVEPQIVPVIICSLYIVEHFWQLSAYCIESRISRYCVHIRPTEFVRY